MALVITENRKFRVEFEAHASNRKAGPFYSIYTALGTPVAVRQPDTRSLSERYMRRYKDLRRTTVRQGIYGHYSLGGYLVFIDKLKSEAEVFLNWRGLRERSYHRLPIGRVGFHAYGPRPLPNISEVVFANRHFFVAWMRDSKPRAA
jgi:hypothetical protein